MYAMWNVHCLSALVSWTHMCVSHMSDAGMTTDIYIRAVTCPRGEALITSHLRFSSNEVASHVKQLPFRPLFDLSLCCLLMCICFDYVYFRIA